MASANVGICLNLKRYFTKLSFLKKAEVFPTAICNRINRIQKMLSFCSKEKLALVKGKTAALSFRGHEGKYSVKISSFYSKPIRNNTYSDFRGSKPG